MGIGVKDCDRKTMPEKAQYSLKQVDVRVKLKEAPELKTRFPMDSPKNAILAMKDMMIDLDREHFYVVNLDSACHPINYHVASIGSLNASIAEPSAIFKAALLSNASNVIVLHNHPSGNPSPSSQDRNITERLIGCGKLLGISVLDHVVIGSETGAYYSFREREPDLFLGAADYNYAVRLLSKHEELQAEEEFEL